MADGVIRHAMAPEPVRRPLVALFHFIGQPPRQPLAQDLGEEMVIAIPGLCGVERGDEKLLMRQTREHSGAIVASRDGVAEWSSQALQRRGQDRKSTRLNSSHSSISYAVFC